MIVMILMIELGDNSLSKLEIFDLVNENYGIIQEDIKENNFEDTLKIKGVQDVLNEDEDKWNVLEFECGGRGFGSGTSYYGFYYSPDDSPYAPFGGSTFCKSEELIMDGKGYSCKEEKGDNRYYTERIRENFYYYEAHF